MELKVYPGTKDITSTAVSLFPASPVLLDWMLINDPGEWKYDQVDFKQRAARNSDSVIDAVIRHSEPKYFMLKPCWNAGVC